jgi:hypothetical protein
MPLVDDPVHGLPSNFTQASRLVYIAPQTTVAEKAPKTHTPKQNEVPDPPKLLPRLAEDSNPTIVSSSDSDRKVADLLQRKHIKRATKVSRSRLNSWQIYSAVAWLPSRSLGGGTHNRISTQFHGQPFMFKQGCFASTSAALKLLEPIQHRDNHLPERMLGLNQTML